MAYGESNGHVTNDVICSGLLIQNWLRSLRPDTPLPETIKLLGNIEKKQIQ